MMELLAALENSGFGTWLRESPSIWAYPAVLTLHTIGLGVLVGGNAVLDLRLLGWGRAIPLAPLEKLFPDDVGRVLGERDLRCRALRRRCHDQGDDLGLHDEAGIIVVGVVLLLRSGERSTGAAHAGASKRRRAARLRPPRWRCGSWRSSLAATWPTCDGRLR